MRAPVLPSKTTAETLFLCPVIVECSQATSLVYFHNLIFLSSDEEAMRLVVGWKQTQLQPRSWPSSTFTHSIYTPMNELRFLVSVSFFLRTEKSQILTVESRDPDTIRFF